MNHVNLSGKINSDPKIVQLENGRRIAQFSLATQESYLDSDGNVKNRKNWHRICAWGNWVSVLETIGEKGINLAIEGKLVSRFYKSDTGQRKMITEVEINDLVVIS